MNDTEKAFAVHILDSMLVHGTHKPLNMYETYADGWRPKDKSRRSDGYSAVRPIDTAELISYYKGEKGNKDEQMEIQARRRLR